MNTKKINKMKKLKEQSFILFLMLLTLLISAKCNSQSESKTDESKNELKLETIEKFMPPISEEIASKKADSILKLMSLEEKLLMIKGDKFFFIKGFEKYNIPNLYLSDATQGVNIRQGFDNADFGKQIEKSTAFPAAIALTSTWNPELARNYAKSIGEECRAGGIGVLLGPGMNIYRHSQCGRNFEYFGEDPFLASRMIENYVLGVQSTGTITTLKHFVANNTDHNRRASNSVVSERALHEIYTPAFKAGIDAGAMAVMTSYNQVNGQWAGQSDYVINQLLRKDLGFNWLVMTDWWSVNDAKKLVLSGQDLEMAGGESMHNIQELLDKGEITEAHIDRMVKSILKTEIAMGFLERPIKDESYLKNFDQHVAVAHQTAAEGIVLLRNENNILPLDAKSDKKILLVGDYIKEILKGFGSGEVAGFDHVTLEKALTSTFPNLTYSAKPKDKEISEADIVIVSTGIQEGEGNDRSFSMHKKQEDFVKKCAELNKNVVVLVTTGSGIRMTDWYNKVSAIVYTWYMGQQGYAALVQILSGKISPSGHLPISIEKEFSDSPGYGYVADGYNFKFGWATDPDIKKAEKMLYDVEYKEDVLVGYRWYDTKKIEPLYPFGFGLSYTTFEYKNFSLSAEKITKDGLVEVSFDITNTGKVDAASVAQIYVQDVECTEVRPEKELKAFKKVFLKAGETQTVKIVLGSKAFAFWSEKTKAWTVEAGDFNILLAQSSRDIKATKKLVVK